MQRALATLEGVRHEQDSQGQILALAVRLKSLTLFKVFLLRSEAAIPRQSLQRGRQNHSPLKAVVFESGKRFLARF